MKTFLINIINCGTVIQRLLIGCSFQLLPLMNFSQPHDDKTIDKTINTINKSTISYEKKLVQLSQLSRQMQTCSALKDSSYAYFLQMESLLYYHLGDYKKGIEKILASITCAKNLFVKNDICKLLLYNYNLLYFLYAETNNTKGQYETVDSCIHYALQYDKGYDIAEPILNARIVYLLNKGEYYSCLKDAQLGETIISQYLPGKQGIENKVFVITMQANVLDISGDTLSAITMLEDKKQKIVEEGYVEYTGPLDNLLGLRYLENKDYKKALFLFKQAYKHSAAGNFKAGKCQSLAYTGAVYGKNLKQHDEGLKYCNAALKLAEPSDSLSILTDIGIIYTEKKMFDKALYFFQQAFNITQPGLDENNILNSSFLTPDFNLLQNLLNLLAAKANALVLQYRNSNNISYLKKSIAIYKKADLFLSKIKAEYHLQFESNLVWKHSAHALYDHAIEACYANKDVDNAFYFFEKSRAILLNDQINQQHMMADSDRVKQIQLKKKISQLELRLKNYSSTTKEYLGIQKNIYYESRAIESLLANVKIKKSLFYQDYLDSSFVTVSDVKYKILGQAKGLIEIYTGDSAVYVLTILAEKQSLVKINKQVYDSLTGSYIRFINTFGLLNTHFNDFINISRSLYRLIFQNDTLPYGSVIISPDGKNFPFESLITNNDVQHPVYFLNNYAVSYTYSAKYLTNHFAETTVNISFLGMAPVRFDNYPHMAVLNGSENSLMRIEQNFKDAEIYTFAQATKMNFFKHFSNYSILQLYTHASDSSDRNNPVIYFSDTAIYLSELLSDGKPITRLVVLSACQTANGSMYKGEGVFSFNRGFASLGIPAAISNLWDADNESTYEITELFYQYIHQGLPTDVALQKAKLAFINKSNSKVSSMPYFWASGILMGKVETFTDGSNKKNWNTYLIVFAAAALSTIILYYLLKKVKNRRVDK